MCSSDKPSYEEIKAVAVEATFAFWGKVTKAFPEIKLGVEINELSFIQFQLRTEIVIQSWINNNWPETEPIN
jgi:hypothetical protein